MEPQICSLRSLDQKSATLDWYMEYKACPLVHLWLLTQYSKLSQCLTQAPKKPRGVPDRYDGVVIGSGFGGTTTALTLANVYVPRNIDNKEKNEYAS